MTEGKRNMLHHLLDEYDIRILCADSFEESRNPLQPHFKRPSNQHCKKHGDAISSISKFSVSI